MASGTKRRTSSPPALPDASVGVLIGCARVSTEDQKLDFQRDALVELGCHRVFEDRASGSRRPARLGRITHQLVNLLERFEREGVRLRSLQDGIDRASVMGKVVLQIGAVFAGWSPTCCGSAPRPASPPSARGDGSAGASPPYPGDGIDTARRLMADPLLTMEEIASRLGVVRTTLYRALGRAQAAPIGATAATKAATKVRAPGRTPRVAAMASGPG